MLALGGGGLCDGVDRLGDRGRRGGRDLEMAHVAAGGKAEAQAQQGRRCPKAAAHSPCAPSQKPIHFSYSYCPSDATAR